LIDERRTEGVSFAGDDGAEVETRELAVGVLGRLSVIKPYTAGQALDGLMVEVGRKDENLATLSMVVIDSVDALLGGEALTSSSAQGESRARAGVVECSLNSHSCS
jgi:hypothetical protein